MNILDFIVMLMETELILFYFSVEQYLFNDETMSLIGEVVILGADFWHLNDFYRSPIDIKFYILYGQTEVLTKDE